MENPHVAILGPSGVGKSVAFAAILVDTMVGPPESRPDQVCAGRPQEGLRAPVRLLRRGAGALGGGRSRGTRSTPCSSTPERHLDQQLQDVLGLLALATTTPTAPMSPEDYAFWAWALRGDLRALRHRPRGRGDAGCTPTTGRPARPRTTPPCATCTGRIGPEAGVRPADDGGAAARLGGGDVLRAVRPPHHRRPGGRAAGGVRPGGADPRRRRAGAPAPDGHLPDRPLRLGPGPGARRKKRLLGTDEVATLLAYPATARFFGNLLAMGRCYGLSVFHM